jgi:hypothetical protein
MTVDQFHAFVSSLKDDDRKWREPRRVEGDGRARRVRGVVPRTMDLRRKPPIHARSSSIGDDVVVDTKAVRVVHHARAWGRGARTDPDLDETLTLASIGAALPLASIYEHTPLGRRPV